MASSYPMVRMHRDPKPGRRKPGRKPYFRARLPYQRQVERLERKLEQIASTLSGLEAGLDVSSDPRAVVPERALVLVLAQKIRDFEVASQALGFEWLTSADPGYRDIPITDDEAEPAEDDAALDELRDEEDVESQTPDEEDKPSVLYVTMPSVEGLRRLLATWRRYKDQQTPVEGEERLFKLFDYLLDLRTWSIEDRLDPAIGRYVAKLLAQDPLRPVLIEMDLWYRDARDRRDTALGTLRRLVEQERGEFLDFVEIEEIRYQGALVQLPAGVAAQLAEGLGNLASLHDIMTIRPQAAFEPEFVEQDASEAELATPAAPLRAAVAAILDGYPVEQHDALRGRVLVREVEVQGADVPPAQRYHGTAMASLVLHGDLATGDRSSDRRLVVVPILGSLPGGKESTPATRLPIGVVYNALTSLVQAQASDPELRNVVVVNHSLCDTHAPFAGRPSPWAALLDYFSHAYGLLFVVSAGNIFDEFPTAAFDNITELTAADPRVREVAILRALERSLGTRGILSPAESVNALTVGALHADASSPGPADIDPFPTLPMVNLASAVGPGVNRSIKPDLLARGGRFAAGHADIEDGGVSVYAAGSAHMGQLVAAPSPTGDLRRTMRAAGTSNAAALVTRSCVFLADALDDVFIDESPWYQRRTRAVLLKALAAHGCGWGEAGNVLDVAFGPQAKGKHSARRRKIANVLGYGPADVARVTSGARNRVTLLGDGVIRSNQLHEYRIPLVDALLNNRDVRTITATLAWTTSIITTTVDYRGVALQLVDANGKGNFWEGVARSGLRQPDANHVRHGTLTHVVLHGKKQVAHVRDSRGLFFGVQALARHPTQEQEEIPYALAVTIEIAASQHSRLYEQVREALRTRVRGRAQAGRSRNE